MREHHKFLFLLAGVLVANNILPATIASILNPFLSAVKLQIS